MTDRNDAEVFELRYDFTEIPEESYDAVLNPFPGCKNLRLNLIARNLETLPNEVWFWASLERVRRLDFLKVDVRWMVCSKRMLAAIETLGNFPHLAIPAHLSEADEGKSGTVEDEYVVLVVNEGTDAVDYERSEIEYGPDGDILIVKKWCFKSPPDGLPPMFKVKEAKSLLLVTRATKEALEKRGFQRLQFLPQDRIGLL